MKRARLCPVGWPRYFNGFRLELADGGTVPVHFGHIDVQSMYIGWSSAPVRSGQGGCGITGGKSPSHHESKD